LLGITNLYIWCGQTWYSNVNISMYKKLVWNQHDIYIFYVYLNYLNISCPSSNIIVVVASLFIFTNIMIHINLLTLPTNLMIPV